MEKLSTVLTPGTVVRKIIVTNGLHQKKESGWLACVIGGKLKELYIYFDSTGNFVSISGTHYRIDTALKPISGVYSAKTLYGTT